MFKSMTYSCSSSMEADVKKIGRMVCEYCKIEAEYRIKISI